MISSLLSLTIVVACGAAAVVALRRDARSQASWTLALGAVLLAATEMLLLAASPASDLFAIRSWKRWSMLPESLLPGMWLAFSLVFARSDAHERLARSSLWVAIALGVPLAWWLALSEAFFARLYPSSPHLPLAWPGEIHHVILLLLSVAVLVNLEATLRASTGAKRWRIKFVLLGIGSYFAMQVFLASQAILFSAVSLRLEAARPWVTLVCLAIMGAALRRSRDFDGDLHLSHAAAYNSVVVILVGAYLVVVGVLAGLVDRLAGREALPAGILFVFLAVVALAAILLSEELRVRLRSFVSRNFFRTRYDYRKQWTSFTERTASLFDAHALSAVVARIVSEIFGASSVTLWLADEKGQSVSPTGSTMMTDARAPGSGALEIEASAIFRSLPDDAGVIDLDGDSGIPAAERLRRETQIRYVVPLVAARESVGMMTLSERITGEPFSIEDRELLKTIADQAASSLLNVRLSDQLVQTREADAFRTLSAFFVHDLKNLASMLSLTLQNLPRNYDKPGFREEALRVLSDSVAKMNRMCSQLAMVTSQLSITPTRTDLPALVSRTLKDLDGSLDATITRDLRPVPPVLADAEQLSKVVVNLLLNARDAVKEGGEIRVATACNGDTVSLVVSDTGCGMTPEFVEHGLFRAFRTTKSDGMGIGLFQSKRIVDAHGGRIEVETAQGRGSSFRVFLPVES